MKCPQCQFENRDGVRFCEQCGTKMEIECPGCKAKLSLDTKFCGQCGHEVQQGPPVGGRVEETEGERKYVTVLFSDLSGYTSLSEKLDPEELKELTGKLFGGIATVIEKYGGFIEKYVGDAIMAVFGVPFANEDDPVRAIRAAREIHQTAVELDQAVVKALGVSLSMHTGINTGLVVTGTLDGQKGAHGIAGDTVNIASRLCSLAHPGDILVGSETRRQGEGYFDFEELATATVKGKTESLQVFKLLALKEKPHAVHRLSGIRARLTGRDAEMAELQDVAARLARGEGTIVSISGDAGTGKSRLIEEFWKTLDLSRTQWFESHAYPYAQNTPYSLVTGLASHVFGLEEGDAPETVRNKLESQIRTLTGEGTNIIPYIGSLYSLPHPKLEEINPEQWKYLLGSAFTEILSALAHRSRTVIVMEDLQWADPSSLELLRAFLVERRLPSLLIFAYRPEFSLLTGDQTNPLGKAYHEIHLQDLSSSESLQMLRSLLDTNAVPRELERFFQERVQGNPFYVEEVVNGLIDSGRLAHEGPTWKLSGSLDEAAISSGIYEVISARLDLLEREAKRVLQEASVIGRSFLFEILQRVTAVSGQCERCVKDLERLDFVRAKSIDPDLEYMFKHALTQEVVYNGLLKKDRRRIHERIARVMEALFETRLAELYEVLAYHYAQGESPAKAVEYLMKSGEKSLARHAIAEAYQSYEQAYQFISAKTQRTKEDSATLVDVLNSWAFAFYYLADTKKLLELFSSHRDEASSVEDQAKIGMFYAWFGYAHWCSGRVKDACGYLLEAKARAEKAGDQKVLGYACMWLSYATSSMGQFREAFDAGTKAREIGKLFPSDQYLSFKGLGAIAFLHANMGVLGSLVADSTELINYSRIHSNHPGIALGYYMMSIAHFFKGDMPSAIACGRKALDAARDPFYATIPKTFLGGACVLSGRVDEGERELQDVISFHEKYDIGYFAGFAHVFLAMSRILRGRIGEGFNAAEALAVDFLEKGNTVSYIYAQRLLGAVYLEMVVGDDPKGFAVLAKNVPFLITHMPFADRDAQKHLGEAVRASREIGSHSQLGQALLSLGLLHRAKKRRDKARECLAEAVRFLEECEVDGPLKEAKEALGSLGQPTGTVGEA
jgi:class 3 adenylate cyclase/tetratricopeptide (TPR) repeat protein